ncbi:MAG: hypothetical protein PWP64_1121, partial [Candidatus Cloacimonadota bacterium]|nr:hypothetical protein [Candidatus Cloacimonadota bacterium]
GKMIGGGFNHRAPDSGLQTKMNSGWF